MTNNPLDREYLNEAVRAFGRAMRPEKLHDARRRDAIWREVSDYESHCVGWTDTMLLNEFPAAILNIMGLADEKKPCGECVQMSAH